MTLTKWQVVTAIEADIDQEMKHLNRLGSDIVDGTNQVLNGKATIRKAQAQINAAKASTVAKREDRLREAMEAEVPITTLAQAYNVERSTVYRWLTKLGLSTATDAEQGDEKW